ncbi:MAG TPA: Rne/Rng family ribonuclease [Pyrinomonadaceae bacterium]|nr:Rne/Rng family ribonuclease [Pyrinomonadaceae bacterium]
MPKELIVSVNGREKKIAIVENGRVTEFYIERGESSTGIVGNIYKGRVMRVLPGMQSAFVDIGLERDAFLYVSDFFDEEEEFERIVVDKKKSDGADDETAARAAQERIERARLERERQMETAQEQAEPVAASGLVADEEEKEAPDVVETVEAEEAEAPLAPASARAARQAEAEEEETGGRRRGRRRRGRDRGASEEGRAGASEGVGAESGYVRGGVTPEDVATPFVAGADSFERIVDEDAAFDDGAMFKDARVQERILDQIRGVEFDMEDVPVAEVGSLLSTGAATTENSFQRIADDDEEETVSQSPARTTPQTVSVSVGNLADELDEETSTTTAETSNFQRVSDDEQSAEAAAATGERPARTSSKRGASKRGASKRARGTAAASDDKLSEAAAAGTVAGEVADATADAGEAAETPKKRASSSKRAAASKGAAKKAGSASKKSASKGASKRRKSGGETEVQTEAQGEAESNDSSGFADTEARVSTSRTRGEFARRGGRRRRRPGGKAGENGGEEDRSNGHSEEPEVVSDASDAPAPAVAAPPVQETQPPRESQSSRGGGRTSRGGGADARSSRDSESRGAREPRDTRESRDARDSRDSRDSRESSRSSGGDGNGRSGGGSGGGGGRESRGSGRRNQPTITDLLREGQEIIVQIAKEPIAQKGARITSHIALPGRFLVYMPTIEHVGVSRKIESDSERVRLRKLIQSIVKEEDVPSGGFIVRTAGVGISEQELREDARYLARTWRDIRRSADKVKAPALAHRDLDLVQRILRDQLSDDFTAIRVDSEEEYLAVVEFVNRIQPRLVNRVKLYTREEPILEAYGVQAEIDKAIKPRVWLRSGGYLVINQTEALVAIDVNTGKFVGRGGSRLEDTITRTNLEAVDEIARQIRLRDLGGIIVLDLIDMEDRRNRNRVMAALQDALRNDKSPTKVLSFNDFGLVIMTRKRVKQSLERTLCSPCPYCQGSSLVKSPQTVCYEILEEARRLARAQDGERLKQTTLRINPEVARALRSTERDVLTEIEDYLGAVDITSDEHVHQEQFDFAFV